MSKEQRTVGPYRLIRQLGEGAMGVVYEAVHENLKRRCALKICKHEYSDPQSMKRWHRELQAMASLSHPSIISVLDSGIDGRNHFVAMELITGQDLSHALEDLGRLTLEETLWVVEGVFSGLVQVHAAGLVHRDIKPANIMVPDNSCIKLMDFGLVRPVDSTCITGTGTFVGTPLYVAPEVLLGDTVTDRCDCYLAGELIFELLTGRPLWDKVVLADIFSAKLGRHFAPTDLPSSLAPAQLQRLFSELVRVKPKERPSAIEALESLKRISRDYTVGPGRLSPDADGRPIPDADKRTLNATTHRLSPVDAASRPFEDADRRPFQDADRRPSPFPLYLNRAPLAYALGAITVLILVALALHYSHYGSPWSSYGNPSPVQLFTDREPICVRWQAPRMKQVQCVVSSQDAPSQVFHGVPSTEGVVNFMIPRLAFNTPYSIKVSQDASISTTNLRLPPVTLRRPPSVSLGPGWFTLRIDLRGPAPIDVDVSLENNDCRWSANQSSSCTDVHRFLWKGLEPRVQRCIALQVSITNRTHPVTKLKIPLTPFSVEVGSSNKDGRKTSFRANTPVIGKHIYLNDSWGRLSQVTWQGNAITVQALNAPYDTPYNAFNSFVPLGNELGLVVVDRYTRLSSFRPTTNALEAGIIIPKQLSFPIPKVISPANFLKDATVLHSRIYLSLGQRHKQTIIQSIDYQSGVVVNSQPLPGRAAWAPYVTDDYVCIATDGEDGPCFLFGLDADTLDLRWKLKLKGLCNAQAIERDGWLWACDTEGVYRLRPDRTSHQGSQLHSNRGEGFLAIYGADSPPVRIGNRGWLLVKQLTERVGFKLGTPAVTNFAWDSFTDVRKPIQIPLRAFPIARKITSAINLTARDDTLYAIFGYSLLAIDTKTPDKPSVLTFPSYARHHSLMPDGRLVVICREHAYFFRLWPEEPAL